MEANSGLFSSLSKLLAATILLFPAGHAMAAVQTAQSVTYFDAANNIIGHQYINCRNGTFHAGTLTSPYQVIQRWSCYDACYWDGVLQKNFCGSGQNNYYKNVAYIILYNGATAKQFCDGQSAYPGTLSCDALEPEQLTGVGLIYSSGIQ